MRTRTLAAAAGTVALTAAGLPFVLAGSSSRLRSSRRSAWRARFGPRVAGYHDRMTDTPVPEKSEAERIAEANADAHGLQADIEDDTTDDEYGAEEAGRGEVVPRLDPDPDERGHDNDETTPTRTRPTTKP
jgi:hypothetical protein